MLLMVLTPYILVSLGLAIIIKSIPDAVANAKRQKQWRKDRKEIKRLNKMIHEEKDLDKMMELYYKHHELCQKYIDS